MFPESFARDAILTSSSPGDVVFDPFCGRGTAVLEALLNGRQAIGCDINPVAAVISQAKANVPNLERVLGKIADLSSGFDVVKKDDVEKQADSLPEFFRWAYDKNTLLQLLFLRSELNRQHTQTDRFICALILGHLHGEVNRSPNYFSNQLPHTIAPKPGYSVRYWKEHGLHPPRRDAFALLYDRAVFRLQDEPPRDVGVVRRCDVREAPAHFSDRLGMVSSVVTSPPYLDVTSFEEDQWLRLWFLGGAPHPTYHQVSKDDRYTNADRYFGFLAEAWCGIAPLLAQDARITCRIGTRRLSADELTQRMDHSMRSAWLRVRRLGKPEATPLRNRQTDTFRPGSVGCQVEYDFRYLVRN